MFGSKITRSAKILTLDDGTTKIHCQIFSKAQALEHGRLLRCEVVIYIRVLMDCSVQAADEQCLAMDYVSDRLTINISGAIFQTRQRTLARYPDSLLGDPVKRQEYYCPKINAYYFDRHRHAFESILYYYQSGGRLVLPKDMPLKLFFDEVEFFGLGDEALCLVSKGLYARKHEPFHKLMPSRPAQRKIWQTFECPESSTFARVLSLFCISMIVLSIILSCLATSFHFQERYCLNRCHNVELNATTMTNGSTQLCCNTLFRPIEAIPILDIICYIWFLIEYCCRLATSPSKKQFILSFLNFIDFFVVISFFTVYFINVERTHSLSGFRLACIFKLLRLARVIKLSRYSRGLKALGSTLLASYRELKMMMMFLGMVLVVSSCTIYLAELKNPNAHIRSIPDGFWWSVTTVTTVGYGDSFPVTAGGKLVGCLCTVLGALTFSLPVIVFATNFRVCYKAEDSITAEYHRNLRCKAQNRW